jgi:penicillin-binding protein 2
VVGDDHVLSRIEPIPGKDVRVSIDAELQKRIQGAFAHAQIRDVNDRLIEEDALLHGAAVVIDVPTGQVRALVSYPTYDANDFQEHYADLAKDTLNNPLMDRATMDHVEPGSTVKPMVGIAAITSGVQRADATIECTGYLKLDDGKTFGKVGRCWVASRPDIFKELGGRVAHHPLPPGAEHPTGFLTFSDGLERSCNIFFETTADRLKIAPLSDWFSRFGLGRRTGLGIAEAAGKTPIQYSTIPASLRRWAGFSAGIGEGYIAVTPLQMANVAATLARRGIWMRPTLLVPDDAGDLPATTPGAIPDDPSRVDLHLDPAAVDEAQEGMFRVVNYGKAGLTPHFGAGTGTVLVTNDQVLWAADICGKTGTAQTSRIGTPVKDPATGKSLRDAQGKIEMDYLTPSTIENPNASTPWYRGGGPNGDDTNHAWFIGFAPRKHPRIAFAVLVEYGGSGGTIAGSVARHLLHDCIDLGYLPVAGVPVVPSKQPLLSDASMR